MFRVPIVISRVIQVEKVGTKAVGRKVIVFKEDIKMSKAIQGLQRIYLNGKLQSEGQAVALELLHHPPKIYLIVLPTSSEKSVAAMTDQQTVIIAVPLSALIDDVISRASANEPNCEQWIDHLSGHKLCQLIVVSADRAVSRKFLFYAQQLLRHQQLAYMFFDESYVAFTDISY